MAKPESESFRRKCKRETIPPHPMTDEQITLLMQSPKTKEELLVIAGDLELSFFRKETHGEIERKIVVELVKRWKEKRNLKEKD